MSNFTFGHIPWNKGKHTTTNSGKTHFDKGHSPWNKNKKLGRNLEHSQKMKGRRVSPQTEFKKGQHPSKLTEFKKGNVINSGSNHYNWKGGITPLHTKLWSSPEYKLWREAVFARDNYTCVWCGAKNGEGKTIKLNADHIKPFALFPELRFAIDNGRTLCEDCHRSTDTYGTRIRRYQNG